MAKLVLDDIGGGYQTAAAYNANNALIEAALENTLSRDGTSPNEMDAALDMNTYDINNIGITRTERLFLNGQEASLRPYPSSSIGDFEDVTIVTPAANDALLYNAVTGDWENQQLVESDISDFGSYSVTGHTHTVSEVTDFDPSDYLLNTTDVLVGDLSVEGDVDIGVNAGGDSVLNFYDDTNDVNRQIFWDDSEGAFFFEDASGSFQQFGTGSGGGPDLLLMGG